MALRWSQLYYPETAAQRLAHYPSRAFDSRSRFHSAPADYWPPATHFQRRLFHPTIAS
jgi:hypothetical protein